MNLRKKKKRLKKQVESMRAELDSMLKKPAPVVVKHPRVETLRATEYVVDRGNGIPEHAVVSCLIKNMKLPLRPYITIHKEEVPLDEYGVAKYRYSATLRVVVPDGGDGF